MRRLLLVLPVLATACVAAPRAGAQPAPPAVPLNERWIGELRCAPVPGLTSGTLRAPVTVEVSGGVARYHRDVQTQSGEPRGRGEAGEGRLGPDGSVTLEARVAAGPGDRGGYVARYAGRLAGNATTLEGAQDWNLPSGPFRRPCTLTLRRP